MAWPFPLPFGALTGRARLLYERYVLDVVPPWLRREVGGAILSSVGEVTDALAERAALGVKLRYPITDEEALGIIGEERGIVRGPTEAADVYAGRVQAWLEAHQRRGSVYSLLEQWHAYNADAPRDVDVVYQSGTRYQLDGATGTVTRDSISWAPTGGWAQVWSFLYFDREPGFALPTTDLAIDLNLEAPDTVITSAAVETIGDDSGNALHAPQATAAARPAYTLSDTDFAERPAMTFDGTDDGLVVPSFQPGAGGSAFTIYGVIKTGSAGGFLRVFGVDSGTDGGLQVVQHTSGTTLRFRWENTSGNATIKDVVVGASTVVRFAAVFDATTGADAIPKVYIDGVDSGVGYTTTNALDGTDFDTSPAGVGSDESTAAAFFDGKIARIAGYDADHDEDTIQAIDAQLEALYATGETGLTALEQYELTVIPGEWDAAHVVTNNVVLIWPETAPHDVLLWGYPSTTWGAAGLTWPAAPAIVLDAT